MDAEEHRVLRVVYHDPFLTQAHPGPITVQAGAIDSVVSRLKGKGEYSAHEVAFHEYSKEYLIGGVLVSPFRIANPPLHNSGSGMDAISLTGESETGIELVAARLGLPDIPTRAFLHRISDEERAKQTPEQKFAAIFS